MRADVEIPPFEIATGSSIDRCVAEWLRIAGQHDFWGGSALLRKDHRDGGNGGFFRSLFESRFGCRSRMDTGVKQESEGRQRSRHKNKCGSTIGSRLRSGAIW